MREILYEGNTLRGELLYTGNYSTGNILPYLFWIEICSVPKDSGSLL